MLPEASRMNMTLGLTVVPVVEVPSGVVARSIVAAAAVPAEAANVSANTSLRYLRPDGCLMVSPMHTTFLVYPGSNGAQGRRRRRRGRYPARADLVVLR